MDIRTICAVGLGAAIGGIARLLVTQFVVARAGAASGFYATAFINISGSFLIGAVLELVQLRAGTSPLWRYFLATGVLGGYTTFSTFSLEALQLGLGGLGLTSILYVIGSVGLGIAAAFGGTFAVRVLAH